MSNAATQPIQEFIPAGKHNRPGAAMRPTSITIHNTDNASKGAGAKAHSRFVRETGYYDLNGKKQWVSWHFSVDDTYVIQQLPINEVAYHAGSMANASSIAIEICMNSDNDQDAANRNAASLVASLLSELQLKIGDVKKHQDWTKKPCPSLLLTKPKWEAFLQLVQTAMKGVPRVMLAPVDFDVKERGLPEEVDDVEIDHERLETAMQRSVAGVETSGGGSPGAIEAVERILASLVGDGSRGQLAFGRGINDIDLKLSVPGAFELAVSGTLGLRPPSRAREGGARDAVVARSEARAAGAQPDGTFVDALIAVGSDPRSLSQAQAVAAVELRKVGVVYPHNACAATLSALLAAAGIGVQMTLGAGRLASRLRDRGWSSVGLRAQRPGDVGVCFDNTAPSGADHIYLVIQNIDGDRMVIADNQAQAVTHERYASGKGKTPTEYFLRAPGAGGREAARDLMPVVDDEPTDDLPEPFAD